MSFESELRPLSHAQHTSQGSVFSEYNAQHNFKLRPKRLNKKRMKEEQDREKREIYACGGEGGEVVVGSRGGSFATTGPEDCMAERHFCSSFAVSSAFTKASGN